MSGSTGRRPGSVIDAEIAYGRSLLRAHATPLFAIASLLVEDDDAASQVLVDVIADASPDASIRADAPELRALLAGHVYRRCLDLISARNGARRPTRPSHNVGAAAVLAQLSLGHRAVVGLVLIGGQDLALAAATLGASQLTVLSDLVEAIEAIRGNTAAPATSATGEPGPTDRARGTVTGGPPGGTVSADLR